MTATATGPTGTGPTPVGTAGTTAAAGTTAPSPTTAAGTPAFELPDAPVRRSGTPTPVTLRRLAVACAVTAILAGLFVGLASYQRAGRLEDAADKARQVVVLTDARSQVAAADAAATAAFLVGGVEDAEGRNAYLDALSTASDDLNAAAASGIGDTDAIAGIAEGVGAYRGTVEYARALNRQNLPLGSAYLRSAGTALATDVVEPLDAEIASVRGSIQTNAPVVTVLLAAVAVLAFLAVFLYAIRTLFHHTRRLLNVGVVVGGLAVVVVVLGWVVVTFGVTSSVNAAVDGPLRDTTQIAQIRTDVFDARSAQNLALIARGSGQTYLTRLDDDLDDARARGLSIEGTDGSRIMTELNDFSARLESVSAADGAGDYDEAVAIATDGDRPDGVVQQFATLDQVTAEILADRADAAIDELTGGRPALLVVAVAAVVVGILGAALAWSGIGQRRKEYM